MNLLIATGGYAGHKAGLLDSPPDLLGPPVGGSEWIAERMRRGGLLQDSPGSAGDTAGGFTGGLLGMLAGAKPPVNGLLSLIKPAQNSKMVSLISDSFASKSPRIYDPKPTAQRPFHDDYPQGARTTDDGRLLFDLEGRPLSARYVAGRNMGGMVDEPLPAGGAGTLADLLGIPASKVPRTGPDLKGDAGRFVSGPDRRFYVDQALPPEQGARVFEHETSHAIEDLVYGAKIPTTGLKNELAQVYSDLNSMGYVAKGKIGAKPQTQGYSGADIDREYMAEAIRAYMRDPNYLKTVAPKTAARIREYVNANQNLNKTIQFNSLLGPTAGAGLLGTGLSDEAKQ